MQAIILLAVWTVVVSCADDGLKGSADNPEQPNGKDEQRADTVHSDADPFLDGSSYRFVMTTKSTPGLEKSSATVKVFIREFVSSEAEKPAKGDDVATKTNPTKDEDGDSDSETTPAEEDEVDNTSKDTSARTLATKSEVRLSWECGDEPYRGATTVKMPRLDSRLDVSLTELPALKRINDSIKCKLNATLDTTKTDGKRVIVTGSHEFYIDMDILYPALRLDNVEITEVAAVPNTPGARGSSTVAFKVTLIRQGKVVVKGDPVFDKDVEVELTWECNDKALAKDRSKSSAPTDLTIAAAKAEGDIQLNNLPNTILGESGYACLITATAEIEGYEHDVEGKKKIWIEGKDLQVAVTSVSNNRLSYVVMKRYQQLTDTVKLSLESCNGITITITNGEDQRPNQGNITITGTTNSDTCKLKAQLMDGNEPIREGVSKEFSIPSALRQMEDLQ